MNYNDIEEFNKMWQKEEKNRIKDWYKSKKKKFVVTMNWGGGLSDIIEVRHNIREDDSNEFWSLDGNVGYKKDETKNGYQIKGFKKEKDAKLFLEGAKAFRDFIVQSLVETPENE